MTEGQKITSGTENLCLDEKQHSTNCAQPLSLNRRKGERDFPQSGKPTHIKHFTVNGAQNETCMSEGEIENGESCC